MAQVSQSSDTVWTRTHRVGGYVFMAAGVLCLVSAALTGVWAKWVMFGGIVAAGLITTGYSYVACARNNNTARRDARLPPGAGPGGGLPGKDQCLDRALSNTNRMASSTSCGSSASMPWPLCVVVMCSPLLERRNHSSCIARHSS